MTIFTMQVGGPNEVTYGYTITLGSCVFILCHDPGAADPERVVRLIGVTPPLGFAQEIPVDRAEAMALCEACYANPRLLLERVPGLAEYLMEQRL